MLIFELIECRVRVFYVLRLTSTFFQIMIMSTMVLKTVTTYNAQCSGLLVIFSILKMILTHGLTDSLTLLGWGSVVLVHLSRFDKKHL